jgi:hypothetical protein
MSIGYLVDPDQAVVWRGPMVMSAVSQLINDTDWGDLDLLFIDTPPGTGEVQLTLVQKLPLDGAVIVSTPQEVALADVRRGVGMFRKTHVPVLGVIENMAWFEQPDGARLHLREGRRTAHGRRAWRALPGRPAHPVRACAKAEMPAFPPPRARQCRRSLPPAGRSCQRGACRLTEQARSHDRIRVNGAIFRCLRRRPNH